MKKFVSIAIAITAMSATPALAQDRQYSDAEYAAARATTAQMQQRAAYPAGNPALSAYDPFAACERHTNPDMYRTCMRERGRAISQASRDRTRLTSDIVRERSRYARERQRNGNRLVRDVIRAVSR